MKPSEALRIATIAHGAIGQTRANGDPYIVHPKKVKLLAYWFMKKYWHSELLDSSMADHLPEPFNGWHIHDLFVAAYLHDVLEDTKLTSQDLIDYGIDYAALDLVERMTKPDSGPAPQSYYQRISEHTGALILKCADRCSNLEDAYSDLFRPVEVREVRRWAKYVEKTYTDVLPMYVTMPGLKSEIAWRLKRIDLALPKQKAEREAYVERDRIERGIPPGKQFILSHDHPNKQLMAWERKQAAAKYSYGLNTLCLDCDKAKNEPGVPGICAAWHTEAA